MSPETCLCGSLLSPARCCALEQAALAAPDAERPLLPLVREAELAARDQPDRALILCLEVLELSPGQRQALWLLAGLHRDAGRAAASEALLRRLVALDPNHIAATHALTLALLERGNAPEAELHARNAVRIAPQHPQSHNLLALAITEAGQPHTGEQHYRRALGLLRGRDPILLANLAWSLKLQGRMQEARALYGESAAAAPGVFQTWLGYARLEEADRHFDRAERHLDRARHLRPEDPNVALLQAVLHGRQGRPEAALQTLETLGDQALGVEEWLQKGRLLDQLERYDEAFAAFTEGKALLRRLSGRAWQQEAAETLVARLRAFFIRPRLTNLPRAEPEPGDAKPLFILGFPRSGTTLVEQMLSAHGSIAAGGELPLIGEIAELMPRLLNSPLAYPEALAELWMGDRQDGLTDLRQHYLRRLARSGAVREHAPYVTDKMPLNETHLGLIALLFPEAPMIHVQRHPLDVVLSAFSNQLTHGFCCAFDLVSAARHYALIAELMEHYRAELDRPPQTLRYETLVATPEPALRELLDGSGLAFEPACLAVEANQRYAPTASYAQVSQPLYDRSVNRWRNYRTHLEPVLPILAPVLGKLGYAA